MDNLHVGTVYIAGYFRGVYISNSQTANSILVREK